MSRPPHLYVGNYEFDINEHELEDAFRKFGKIQGIEFKSGFCFIQYEDEEDAKEAIRSMNNKEWGPQGRRLRVEFAKNEAHVRERQLIRRQRAQPNNTLFVAGFNPRTISTAVLESTFDAFGRIRRCEIRKSFAFVEFDSLEDAKGAFARMQGQKIDGKEITVEYLSGLGPRSGSRGAGGNRGGGGDRFDDRGGGGWGGGYRDRSRDRGRSRERERDGPHRGGGGGGRGRDRYDDRGGAGGGYRGGGYPPRGRSRSRSYERRRDDRGRDFPPRRNGYDDRRDRSRSPRPRRGRSVTPRRSPPPGLTRRRSRSPAWQ